MTEDKDTQKFDWNLLKRFLAYLKPYKLKISLMYVMTLLQVGSSITIPILIQRTIDGPITNKDAKGLIVMAAGMFGAYLILYISAAVK